MSSSVRTSSGAKLPGVDNESAAEAPKVYGRSDFKKDIIIADPPSNVQGLRVHRSHPHVRSYRVIRVTSKLPYPLQVTFTGP